MKKVLSIFVSAALTLGLLSCGNSGKATEPGDKASTSESAAQADSGGGKTFAYCTSTLNNPYMKTIADALESKAKQDGNAIVTYDPQYDQPKQISQIEDAITKKVDGIFLLAVDSDGVKTALKGAAEKGIPVVAVDNPVADKSLVISNVATDNFKAGYIAGEKFVADFPGGAKIAIVDYPTVIVCSDRVDGFNKAIEDKGLKDKVVIAAQQDANGSLEKAMPIAENMLQANPDIQAFFAINDPSALGVVAALKAAGKKVGDEGVRVYSIDGSPDGKVGVTEGVLASTSAQSPQDIASIGYDTMMKHLQGETVEKDILVPSTLIDKANVDQFGTTGWQ